MMMLSEAGKAMHATLMNHDYPISSVEIDSRRLDNSALYFAIHGDTNNGHRFIAQAIANGAAAVVADEGFPGADDTPHLAVKDTTLALGELAAWWRSKFSIPVVGVTGSNGKTTVCRILSCLFKDELPGVFPQGSFNNHWGVPLTLLKLREQHASAVIEMGMNHAGELDYLGRIVRPTIGLITNAAAAHLAGLHSVEGVAMAKGELIDHVAEDGVVVLNRDDPFYSQWKARAGKREVTSFGTHLDADFRILDARPGKLALSIVQEKQQFKYALLGQHNQYNAAAAIAVATVAGVSLDSLKRRLKKVKAVRGRLDVRRSKAGFLLIDDSYNANPASVRAAIEVLAEQAGQRVLVLGAMGELGADSERVHEQIGAYAREKGVESLLTLVDQAEPTYMNDMAAYLRGFGKNGRAFGEVRSLVNAIDTQQAITVLVKGSRFAAMERIVDALLDRPVKGS